MPFASVHVVRALLDNLRRDLALAAHRIDGNDGAFDRQQIEKFRDCCDLIGFISNLALAEHHRRHNRRR